MRDRELIHDELTLGRSVRRELLPVYRGYHEPIAALIQHTCPPVKGDIHIFHCAMITAAERR